MSLFRELISSREVNVDAVSVSALVALGAMIVFSGIQLIQSPALFSGSTFAFGCASLIGAMGGAKGIRTALSHDPKDDDDGKPTEPCRDQPGEPCH